MKYYKLCLLSAVLCWVPILSLGSDSTSLQDYELVVVESLPDEMSLDLTLEEIIQVKHKSRLAQSKRKFFKRATNALEVILKSRQAARGKRLVELARTFPIQSVLNNILKSEEARVLEADGQAPFDFTILVFPKAAKVSGDDAEDVDYGQLYAGVRTSLIDPFDESRFGAQQYNEKVNQRFEQAVAGVYRRHYLESPENPDTFFVGAMLNIHMEGPRSSARFQVMGGLPTGMSREFLQDQKEVFLRSFNSPKVPTVESLGSADFPGVILTLDYRPALSARNATDDSQLVLGITFGSLAVVGDMEWLPADHLQRFNGTPSMGLANGWKGGGYNVPHLIGDLKTEATAVTKGGLEETVTLYARPSGKGVVDWYLSRYHRLQVNIHEVYLDIKTLKVLDVRVSLDFPKSGDSGFSLPTLVDPSVGEQVKAAANEQLKPFQERIEKAFGDKAPGDMNVSDAVSIGAEIKEAFREGLLKILEGRDEGGLQ